MCVHMLYVSPHSMDQLDHCLEAAHLVVAAIEPQLTVVGSKNVQKSFRSSAALMLYLIAKLDSFQTSQDSSVAKQASEMKARGLHVIHKVLMGWLQQSMLRDRFGGIYGQTLISSKHEMELKVHNSLAHTCTHMHKHMHTHAQTHAHTQACTHTRKHAHTHARKHTHMHTCTHTHIHTHTCEIIWEMLMFSAGVAVFVGAEVSFISGTQLA